LAIPDNTNRKNRRGLESNLILKLISHHEMNTRTLKNKNQGKNKYSIFHCAKGLPVEGTANGIMLPYVQRSRLRMKKMHCEETTMAQIITITVATVFVW
jgi:hypothetical protein